MIAAGGRLILGRCVCVRLCVCVCVSVLHLLRGLRCHAAIEAPPSESPETPPLPPPPQPGGGGGGCDVGRVRAQTMARARTHTKTHTTWSQGGRVLLVKAGFSRLSLNASPDLYRCDPTPPSE